VSQLVLVEGDCLLESVDGSGDLTAVRETNTKGTVDPEGARLLTYSLYAYGKPRLPPVHKYSSLRSTAHHAAGGRCRGHCATCTALAV